MRQLLEYGIRLARTHKDEDAELAPDVLLKEAEVRINSAFVYCLFIPGCAYSVLFKNSNRSNLD